MKTYKHIFFDLDHTLWDFRRNSQEVLTELFDTYTLESLLGVSFEDFFTLFRKINRQLWRRYERQEITQYDIKNNRFAQTFEILGKKREDLPEQFELNYSTKCRQKSHLIPYTIDVLDYLKQKNYPLHILTNGFREAQHTKMTSANIIDYFDTIITADSVNYSKPHPKIFECALSTANANPEESLMIGDNPDTDILGANKMGMDTAFFNPHNVETLTEPTFEIVCLSELKKRL